MPRLLKTLMRALARVAASESGELLSTRDKVHLLFGDSANKLSAPAGRTARRSPDSQQ